MRVYVPGTSRLLRELADSGELGPAPLTAFAVTPGLREHYVDDDIEELEYAAASDAARSSLRLLAADPAAARRRVVIAADVAEDAVTTRDDLDRGVVRVNVPIQRAWCASVHVDDSDAESTVRVAAGQIDAADLGDPAAEELVDDTEGFELCWYALQELEHVVAELRPGAESQGDLER